MTEARNFEDVTPDEIARGLGSLGRSRIATTWSPGRSGPSARWRSLYGVAEVRNYQDRIEDEAFLTAAVALLAAEDLQLRSAEADDSGRPLAVALLDDRGSQ
ncbi:hypothetical protein GCM10022232_58890 [Streptomyces plumbiresistens]|uniref:Uncharacterized protein n=1 Tax=Streptomyces plumbiresistens TaxID=511811 RepID=A0ABP7SDE2_9ACTN